MSTNDPQGEYFKAIGQRVLQEQLAAQQQQQAPMDNATAQRQRNWQIASDRARAAQEREIEAARERQRQFDKQREKEQAKQQEAYAEQLESDTKEAARQEWIAAGNTAATFESQWKQQYLHIMQQRVEERDAQAKAKFLQRYGGF